MKLNETITINPPPYTDQNTNKVVNPPEIVLELLDVSYTDHPISQTVYAAIKNIPSSITILHNEEYILAGDYTQAFIENKLRTTIGDDPAKFLRSLFPKTLEENPNGAGTILTGMISALGIKSSSTCSCRRNALDMNDKGNDWCEQNMDVILGWLKEESQKRGLPFVETVARLMVNRAISKSRKLLANG